MIFKHANIANTENRSGIFQNVVQLIDMTILYNI